MQLCDLLCAFWGTNGDFRVVYLPFSTPSCWSLTAMFPFISPQSSTWGGLFHCCHDPDPESIRVHTRPRPTRCIPVKARLDPVGPGISGWLSGVFRDSSCVWNISECRQSVVVLGGRFKLFNSFLRFLLLHHEECSLPLVSQVVPIRSSLKKKFHWGVPESSDLYVEHGGSFQFNRKSWDVRHSPAHAGGMVGGGVGVGGSVGTGVGFTTTRNNKPLEVVINVLVMNVLITCDGVIVLESALWRDVTHVSHLRHIQVDFFIVTVRVGNGAHHVFVYEVEVSGSGGSVSVMLVYVQQNTEHKHLTAVWQRLTTFIYGLCNIANMCSLILIKCWARKTSIFHSSFNYRRPLST